jgi:hypothetical protein
MLKFIHTEDGDRLEVAHEETLCKMETLAYLLKIYSAKDIVDVLYASGYSIIINTGYLYVNKRKEDTKNAVWLTLKAIPENIIKAQLLVQLMEKNNA